MRDERGLLVVGVLAFAACSGFPNVYILVKRQDL